MRLNIVSDLHVDVDPSFQLTPAADADVLVVAGDVCEGIANAMAWLRHHVPRPTPIIMIAGNHEYYRHVIGAERAAAGALGHMHDVTWLDTASAVIGGVRFLGATLWTDFCFGGREQQAVAMDRAVDGLNDYHRILTRLSPPQRLRPAETLAEHLHARAYLEAELAKPFGGPTVLVTHHAPHPRSVAARFEGDPVNAAFISDLSDVIANHAPTLWIHGHTHTSFDYRAGATRVVCNPKGYGRENPAFDPHLVVDLADHG